MYYLDSDHTIHHAPDADCPYDLHDHHPLAAWFESGYMAYAPYGLERRFIELYDGLFTAYCDDNNITPSSWITS